MNELILILIMLLQQSFETSKWMKSEVECGGLILEYREAVALWLLRFSL